MLLLLEVNHGKRPDIVGLVDTEREVNVGNVYLVPSTDALRGGVEFAIGAVVDGILGDDGNLPGARERRAMAFPTMSAIQKLPWPS